MIKNKILKFINKPDNSILSSQTLYESVFYLINLYEVNQSTKIKNKLDKVVDLICKTQLPDGGFDIGYDFIFGKGLNKKNKKEGTSPELLSLTALSLYYKKIEKSDIVKKHIELALNWIFDRIIYFDNNNCAIPYAPDSYNKVHITNATSFALSSLATSIDIFPEKNEKIISIVYGMYSFMYEQLEFFDENSAYWPYFYKNGTEAELELINEKIDNYHISQQLYHHLLANEFIPSSINEKTIELVKNYLITLIDESGFIPYTINGGKVSDKVDTWGYTSVIGALSYYSYYHNDDTIIKKILLLRNYTLNYIWNEKYFAPIVLNSTKEKFDNNFYPRSDAWVVHSLSELIKINKFDDTIKEICSSSYTLIENQNFKGLENHTINLKKRIFAKIVYFIKAIIKR